MKSMTGFGKSLISTDDYHIELELKTVNNRFLDVQFRMPREYQEYELLLRNELKKQLGRGRVECHIRVHNEGEKNSQLTIQWHLLDQLLTQLDTANQERYQQATLPVKEMMTGLVNHPDFFEIKELEKNDETMKDSLLQALNAALVHLEHSRQIEGDSIQSVLVSYLAEFEGCVAEVSRLSDEIEEDYGERLALKLAELVGDAVDQNRLLTEVALLIEKGDIHEELDRLTIHIEKMQELLQAKTPVGRELDFVIQEMNREVNTTGSKSTNMQIKDRVVQMKTILEKIREQVQNVE